MKKLKKISKEQFLELASVGATVMYDHARHSRGYSYSYGSHDTLLGAAESVVLGSGFRTAQEFQSTKWVGREIEFKFYALVEEES